MVVPNIIFWLVMFPLICFIGIWKNKNHLDDISNRLNYGFFYKDYKN